MEIGFFALYVVAAAIWLWLLFLVIKAGVRQGLREFLRDASAVEDDRISREVPRRVDRLAEHLAAITRRRPPEE